MTTQTYPYTCKYKVYSMFTNVMVRYFKNNIVYLNNEMSK